MSPLLNQAVANAKQLTDHEAADLLLEAQAGSAAARQALIEDCYEYIAIQTRKYGSNTGYDDNDLFAVGVGSVNRSIDRFDHRILGIHFRAFARRYIPLAMARYAGEHQHTIKFREHFRYQRTQTGEKAFTAPSMLSLSVEPEVGTALSEKLVDHRVARPSDGVAAAMNREWLYGAMTAAQFTPNERDLINRLYGLNQQPQQTQPSVAKLYGCPKQYISERASKLLRRLRHHLLAAERKGRLCMAA